MSDAFWKEKTLGEMNRQEWESLCDGCGKCCLHKLEDEQDGGILYTQVACRYLDDDTCRCREYAQRINLVPDCMQLDASLMHLSHWLPQTCAYRCLAEGRELAAWHPLISGDHNTVHRAGISVKGKVISEEFVHPSEIEEQVITWVR